jgi:hypothetical protein
VVCVNVENMILVCLQCSEHHTNGRSSDRHGLLEFATVSSARLWWLGGCHYA